MLFIVASHLTDGFAINDGFFYLGVLLEMDREISMLLSWIESKDQELVRCSLENLCNLILFNNDDYLYRRLQPCRFVRATLDLLYVESMPEEVLELNVRALRFLLEFEPESLRIMRYEDYNQLCQCLERADLSTIDGKEFAENLVKVRNK